MNTKAITGNNKQTLTIEVFTFAIKDNSGNIWAIALDDPSDTVQVYGLECASYFESEAYHLQQWAKENSLFYSENTIQLPVTFEFT